jgi:SAM-dependent methyltransferase
MTEINLMNKFPSFKRDINKREEGKTEEDRLIARKFGKDFFDGDRRYGYGGYNYNPRFWTGVVEDMIDYYQLKKEDNILEIGCAKGFMLYDFMRILLGIKVRGIDISEYAVNNAKEEVKSFVKVGNANDLKKFLNKEFDLVISLITLHNLPLDECKNAIKEIERIGKKGFITLDAWRNEEEKERILKWNLTAKTILSNKDWKKLFQEVDYKGDYYWNVV